MAAESGKRLRVAVVAKCVDNVYWTSIVSGIAQGLAPDQVQLLCFTMGVLESAGLSGPSRTHALYQIAASPAMDGLVALTSGSFPAEAAEYCLQRKGLPTVSVGQKVRDVPSVWLHNSAGIQLAMKHLADGCGRRRIAMVRGLKTSLEDCARSRAYEDDCLVYSTPVEERLVVQGDFTESSGRRATELLLEQNADNLPDAILVSNDFMALGVLAALRERGLRVPDDVAVVGFDDLAAAPADPPLTTIRQPVLKMGRSAGALMSAQLHHRDVTEDVLIEPELIIRASCGYKPSAEEARAVGPSSPAQEHFENAFLSALSAAGLANGIEHFEERRERFETFLEDHPESLRALQSIVGKRQDPGRAKRLPAVLDQLARLFTPLGISDFHLVLFEDPKTPLEAARLVYSYAKGGRVALGPTPAVVRPEQDPLPRGTPGSDEPGLWLVEPLPTAVDSIGYAVLRAPKYDVHPISDMLCALGETIVG